MKLIRACTDILTQLGDVIDVIEPMDFHKPSPALSGSTVGQHLRHTLEFFLCLESGYTTGTINYDKRSHDKQIEQDKVIARQTISRIQEFISQMDLDRALLLELSYDGDADREVTLETTTARELVYNIEHAVHHMALMKIGIREVAPYIVLEKNFGVAASTVRHQERHASKAE